MSEDTWPPWGWSEAAIYGLIGGVVGAVLIAFGVAFYFIRRNNQLRKHGLGPKEAKEAKGLEATLAQGDATMLQPSTSFSIVEAQFAAETAAAAPAAAPASPPATVGAYAAVAAV